MGSRSPLWRSLAIVNCLTLTRLLTGIFSAISFYSERLSPYLAALFLYILISDLLDGLLARRLRVCTRAGAIFDYVVDRFNYYLVITILSREGVPPLLFLPFFIRDLLYVGVQAYLALDSIRGTKGASVGGSIATYIYLLVLNYTDNRSLLFEGMLAAAVSISLSNLLLRIARLWPRLKEELHRDLLD